MKLNLKCRICENTVNNKSYEIQENMYGCRDRFTYFQCMNCGCLQIKEIQPDMSKYYPVHYISMLNNPEKLFKNYFMKLILLLRANYAIYDKGLIGKMIYSKYPHPALRSLSITNIKRDSRVLDVGCGLGTLLYSLKEMGFNNVLGVDPFVRGKIIYKNGLIIEKKHFLDIEGEWDVIMFHHSFEHMQNPFETLKHVSNILSVKGICIIRIPIVSSFAWEHYRVHWVQLDAPRHFMLHSCKSIEILVKKANLFIEQIVYDSTDFQFWGSELNKKNIPLYSKHSNKSNLKKLNYLKKEFRSFKKKAERLNMEHRGDQAVFYVRGLTK